MTIKGGIDVNHNTVELRLHTRGGREYKRVFDNTVGSAIHNFKSISELLRNIKIDNIDFYIQQLKILFQYAHVELLNGNKQFQTNYNLWLIDGYIRMLLETTDIKLIAQLLNLDSILYSVEDAGLDNHEFINTDFDLPKNLKVIKDKKITIHKQQKETINDIIKTINNNIISLVKVIELNEPALRQIYNKIIKTASNQLIQQ